MNELCVVIGLFYDKERNCFYDEDGFYVWNIYKYITPNMLFLFKKKKEYMSFEVKKGVFIELFYPEDEER